MDSGVIQWFLNIDRHLGWFFHHYGVWAYAILFLIIFAETAFVVLPFLPGDSLLFAAGALASGTGLAIVPILIVVSVAAVSGNIVNFAIGRGFANMSLHTQRVHKLIKPHHLAQAHVFFQRWGGWAITFSRFFPIIRTIAPFVAGLGRMKWGTFSVYNVIGGVAWGLSIPLIGYYFGNMPIVKENFPILVLGVLVVTVAPAIFVAFRRRKKPAAEGPATDVPTNDGPVGGEKKE